MLNRLARGALVLLALIIASPIAAQDAPAGAPLVLMTDFGLRDGAVSEVKGVAYGVSPRLLVSDLTHEIPAGDIWAGAYRLYQVAPYWPKGTVFVAVVDPGVGTARPSIGVRTKAGHYYILPDNGLITLIDEVEGVAEARRIDEHVNRLPGSEKSNTFHGRDVFGYTGARLAAGVISFAQVGPEIPVARLVRLPHQKAVREGRVLKGDIPVLDVQYGNVWTNIPAALVDELGITLGDPLRFEIFHDGRLVDSVTAPYAQSFGFVPQGQPVAYINSLLNLSLALNEGDYAKAHHVASGLNWTIRVSAERLPSRGR
ncbi:S-adenosyl-l-methionine hydroxide adenosyltransferase family protein [Sphingomonas sp. BIUV-7]|uniref:S-adenosyl-l-methionine hydroxide adenosyltransferase family protein n=1 Tax=Sphingomonas natans TaxID=3063330 RepID=A0ABT8Y9M9_9SPHN|nr:S-adenosyl-l-methionine hydroxide adenosyltransferase family protein [Sphingomonas sp. BIUV-7]MDO6415029.1 S-adenosyl-l-methionine hydroxide adenosyltransferase family protein [Sphingomonas sp. BIUV-7]